MKFNTPMGYNSAGGAFFLVQLISQYAVNGAITETMNSGLDNVYPFSKSLPSNDSPMVGVLIAGDNSQTMELIANTFLMWQSSTPNSIPVPLGYQTWGVSGAATCSHSCETASNWIVTTSQAGAIGKFIVSNASQTLVGNNTLQYGYPTWTGTAKNIVTTVTTN